MGEGVAGRNVPQWRVAEDAIAAADREERRSTLQTFVVALRVRSELRYCRNELDLLYMDPAHLLRIVYFDGARTKQARKRPSGLGVLNDGHGVR